MTSRCTVLRLVGRAPVDANGRAAPIWDLVADDLPVRIAGRRGASGSSTQTVGGLEVQAAVREAHVPAATEGLADGDVLMVTVGECAGLSFRVVEVAPADQQTALRLPIIATQIEED